MSPADSTTARLDDMQATLDRMARVQRDQAENMLTLGRCVNEMIDAYADIHVRVVALTHVAQVLRDIADLGAGTVPAGNEDRVRRLAEAIKAQAPPWLCNAIDDMLARMESRSAVRQRTVS